MNDIQDYAVQFTAWDVAAVSAALDMGMNEARSHRIFRGFSRAIKDGDAAIDIGWALAQMLNNLILQQPDQKQTELLRTFITMVLLAQQRMQQQRETMQ
jgi:hypothetical protein